MERLWLLLHILIQKQQQGMISIADEFLTWVCCRFFEVYESESAQKQMLQSSDYNEAMQVFDQFAHSIEHEIVLAQSFQHDVPEYKEQKTGIFGLGFLGL